MHTHTCVRMSTGAYGSRVRACLTFTGAVGTPEHGALVYVSEGLEQPPYVLVALLLAQHAHKQLPVL